MNEVTRVLSITTSYEGAGEGLGYAFHGLMLETGLLLTQPFLDAVQRCISLDDDEK